MNLVPVNPGPNMLLDTTSDQEADGSGGVLFEEVEDIIYKCSRFKSVIALVQAVKDYKECPLLKSWRSHGGNGTIGL
jgi:hypothetical protein